MVCPRCGSSIEQESSGRCPSCGTTYARKTSVVMKTSAVLIAAGGGEHQVYRSVAEVPADLRKMLQDSTSSPNAATILIADRGGKQEIARAMERVAEVGPEAPVRANWRVLGLSWRNWIGVAIGFASGVGAWLICAHHW